MTDDVTHVRCIVSWERPVQRSRWSQVLYKFRVLNEWRAYGIGVTAPWCIMQLGMATLVRSGDTLYCIITTEALTPTLPERLRIVNSLESKALLIWNNAVWSFLQYMQSYSCSRRRHNVCIVLIGQDRAADVAVERVLCWRHGTHCEGTYGARHCSERNGSATYM